MIPCPYTYANGRHCKGHITAIETYGADVGWDEKPDGTWELGWRPGSHFHLFCSEKGNHAGTVKADALKAWLPQLPLEARQVVAQTLGTRERYFR